MKFGQGIPKAIFLFGEKLIQPSIAIFFKTLSKININIKKEAL